MEKTKDRMRILEAWLSQILILPQRFSSHGVSKVLKVSPKFSLYLQSSYSVSKILILSLFFSYCRQNSHASKRFSNAFKILILSSKPHTVAKILIKSPKFSSCLRFPHTQQNSHSISNSKILILSSIFPINSLKFSYYLQNSHIISKILILHNNFYTVSHILIMWEFWR